MFDVFGTVVDWRSSVIRAGQALRPEVDWPAFADAWRAGYQPAMEEVRSGRRPWVKLDLLHREILDRLLEDFSLTALGEQQIRNLNLVWHRLDPWPDAIDGLTRLKRRYIIAPLSNGNVSLLVEMAKRAGLPWDAVLSAELARAYKPDPRAYLTACDLLGCEPREAMMVAAHQSDLRAAAATGMRTAFVERPLEHGPGAAVDIARDPAFDFHARDLLDLADQLDA